MTIVLESMLGELRIMLSGAGTIKTEVAFCHLGLPKCADVFLTGEARGKVVEARCGVSGDASNDGACKWSAEAPIFKDKYLPSFSSEGLRLDG